MHVTQEEEFPLIKVWELFSPMAIEILAIKEAQR